MGFICVGFFVGCFLSPLSITKAPETLMSSWNNHLLDFSLSSPEAKYGAPTLLQCQDPAEDFNELCTSAL